jgi:transposase
MELSRSTWLITSLSPGGGDKMSKHGMPAGDVGALLARFAELRRKAFTRTGESLPIIVIQEAGLDGFWIHRVLQQEGIEGHVVDPASIATSRRRRRTKTDRIDGETLLRALLAYKRGEPRVCAMVKAPTVEEEDRRRLCRERKALIEERVLHVNRIKGLLFSQGVSGYEPLRRDRRRRLDELQTGDGRPLPKHLKTQIGRELDRLELLLEQIKLWRLSGTGCSGRDKSRRRHRRRCCSTSRASGPSSPPSSGRKGCSDTSTIDARSLLTRA